MKVTRINDLLTVQAAAEALGVKTNTLHKRIKRWQVPTTQVGRTLLIARADLAKARGR